MANERIFSSLRGGGAEPALKKLRNRLLAVNLVSLTLVVVVAFSIIYINFYNRAQNEIEGALSTIPRGVFENVMLSRQSMPAVVSRGVLTAGDYSITISGEAQIPVDYSKSFVVNVMGDGSITVFSMLDVDDQTYVEAVEVVLGEGATAGTAAGDMDIAGRTWRYSMEPGNPLTQTGFGSYAYGIVFLDIEDTNRGLGALAASLFVIGIIAVGAILLISMVVANRAIRPLQESMARQRRFIADASHELKTPIAVIAANAEAAADAVRQGGGIGGRETEVGRAAGCHPYEGYGSGGGGGGGVAGVSRWVENIADEAGRMSELVDNLLALAKAEEKQATVESFDLVAAVCEEADRVEAFLFEKGVAFGFEMRGSDGGLGGSRVTAVGEASAWIASGSDGGTVGASETLTVRTDRAKVQAALSVLLENAVKYTPPGGRVTIAIGGGAENLARNGSGSGRHKGAAVDRMDSVKRVGAYVSVSNTGPYIPPDDLEHIFDRFFRSDPSRSSETGGHGIGLSIAKELARSIGGDLTAASTPQADGEAVNTFTLFI